jgi:hypothetical protein
MVFERYNFACCIYLLFFLLLKSKNMRLIFFSIFSKILMIAQMQQNCGRDKHAIYVVIVTRALSPSIYMYMNEKIYKESSEGIQ